MSHLSFTVVLYVDIIYYRYIDICRGGQALKNSHPESRLIYTVDILIFAEVGKL